MPLTSLGAVQLRDWMMVTALALVGTAKAIIATVSADAQATLVFLLMDIAATLH